MRFLNAASAATVALCLVTGAQAQTTDESGTDAAETAAPAGEGIGDIVVTAQRRSERLQDVPVAVSALSNQFLAENQVSTLQDLGASVPGLVVTNSVNYGQAPLSIRGIGGANGGGNAFADEPVAVYVDDSYVARLRLSTADLVDIGGIEVLRGPQGVLFGRNSTAGAILIRSAAPTDEFYGTVTASASTLDEYRIQGALSGPLTEGGRLKLRLAGGYSNRGGWGENLGGRQLNGGSDWQARAYLRYEPTDSLSIDLIGDASYSFSRPGTINISDTSGLRDQTRNPAGTNIVRPYSYRADLAAVLANDRFAINYPSTTRIKGRNITARINWDLGFAALTSITNYRRWTLYGEQDSDGTAVDPPTPAFVTGGPPYDNVGSNINRSHDKQASQELRLASTGNARFEWLVGAYYFYERNAILPIAIRNDLAGPGGAGTVVTFNSNQRLHNWAAFANASYEIVDGLKLSVGGRYSEERKRFFNDQTVSLLRQFDPPGPAFFAEGQILAAPADLNLKRKDMDFSPRVVLDYKPSRDLLFYASYSQGFKSGGFNAFRGNTPGFEPEESDAYEVGMKADIGPAFRVNTAAFRYDYSNLQVRVPVPTGGVGIETAKSARSQGVEIEATATPTRGLRFDMNVAYLDAKFLSASLSAVTVPSFVMGANPPVVQQDVSGNRLTRAPEWQFGVSGRYEWDVSPGLKATVQGSLRHQSDVFFLETQQDQPTYRGQDFVLVDARVALGDIDDKWEASLFVKNLTNERYFSQIAALFGMPNAALNEPRKFGIQLSGKF